MSEQLTRPIVGIKNRTAQEVFDIMCDRVRLSSTPSPSLVSGDVVEAVAKAIYEATDPYSGDAIATVIHLSDHLFWDSAPGETDLDKQLSAVREICTVAARAAIAAIASLQHKEAGK